MGILLGYGKRPGASSGKICPKTSKQYVNDGRAPDTAEALAKLRQRDKRPLDASTGAAPTQQPVRKDHSQSKRARLVEPDVLVAPKKALPDSPVRDCLSLSCDDTSESSDDLGGDASDSEIDTITELFPHTTIIKVNGIDRTLSTPSGNAWCYVGYKWVNNSCAYDASLEILFMLLNCDTSSDYCTELTAGTHASDVSSDLPNQTLSISSLVLILKRRMALYPLMPPAEVRSIIGKSRTMIQAATLGSKYSSKGSSFTSIWVGFLIT